MWGSECSRRAATPLTPSSASDRGIGQRRARRTRPRRRSPRPLLRRRGTRPWLVRGWSPMSLGVESRATRSRGWRRERCRWSCCQQGYAQGKSAIVDMVTMRSSGARGSLSSASLRRCTPARPSGLGNAHSPQCAPKRHGMHPHRTGQHVPANAETEIVPHCRVERGDKVRHAITVAL